MDRNNDSIEIRLTIKKSLYDKIQSDCKDSNMCVEEYMETLLRDRFKESHAYQIQNIICRHPDCPYNKHTSKVRLRR